MLRSFALAGRRFLSTEAVPQGGASAPIAPDQNIWQETKNRQGRSYYVNTTTGVRTWDHPGSNATVLKIQRIKAPEFKKVSERVYHLLVNSTNAYYGLFVLFCAGLTYRIMFPPKPAPPTIAPMPESK